VIGTLASVVGLFLGLGLAKGLSAIFAALGADIPQSGIVFAPRTIIVSLLAGILITLAASLVPAMRATRVPPIAAVREGAALPRSRFSRFAPYLAGLTLVVGIALLVYGMVVDDLGTAERLSLVGVGCLILFFGVAGLSSHAVKPLARVLGWPAERVAGAAGKLARENSMRNPHRTASTAAALMIGLALITFVAVLAQGLRSSIDDAITQQVSADFVVVSDDNFTPFQPAADEAVAAVSGAEVVGVRGERGRVNGSEKNVTGADPEGIGQVYDFDWIEGSDASLAALGDGGALVEQSLAEEKQLELDSLVIVETPNGTSLNVRVSGIYEAPAFWEMLGDLTISQAAFDEQFENPRNLYTFISIPGGVNPENEQALETALEPFPAVKLDTKEGFSEAQQESLDPLLNLLYVLLALSVIVSLFGIVNTLVLSVFERTRELGMLRAVGMTRRQVRRMIRHESIITALIGTALGMALGILLAVVVTQALSDEGLSFSVPVVSLIVFVIVAIIAGMLAAIFPARRAARLNVLQALQYE
jgi:putative ABC transport system permease protein